MVFFLVSTRINEISSSLSPTGKIFIVGKSANGTPLEKILPTPVLLLLFMGKMRGKDRYSMEQKVNCL